MVEVVGRAFEAGGAALDLDVVIGTGHHGAESGEVVEVVGSVVGHEQVGQAIAVVIAEGGAHGPLGVTGESGLLGGVGEGAVAIVPVQDDAAETGHQHVGPAVVVVITDCGAVGPAGICYACLVGHIRKGSVVVVVEKSAAGLLSGQLHIDIGGVGEVNVRPSITVVVDEGDTAAHRFDDVFLVGGSEVVEVDLGGGS